MDALIRYTRSGYRIRCRGKVLRQLLEEEEKE